MFSCALLNFQTPLRYKPIKYLTLVLYSYIYYIWCACLLAIVSVVCCKTQHLNPDRCDNIDVYVNSSEAVEIQRFSFWIIEESFEHVLVWAAFSIYFFFNRLFHKLSWCQWSSEHMGIRLKAKLDVWFIINLMAVSAGILNRNRHSGKIFSFPVQK